MGVILLVWLLTLAGKHRGESLRQAILQVFGPGQRHFHVNEAPEKRCPGLFEPHRHVVGPSLPHLVLGRQARDVRAAPLQAVIAQRLIPMKDCKGRVPAVEVMVVTSAIREYIIDPEKQPLIQQAIREGVSSHSMTSFDQSLMRLLTKGTISMEEALKNSTNPHEFSLRLKGIEAASDKTWDAFEAVENGSDSSGDF